MLKRKRTHRWSPRRSLASDSEVAVIEGAAQLLRPKLMTLAVAMPSLAPILWEPALVPSDEAHCCADRGRNDHLDD
jgi:Cu/Ag efflux pump CusA